MSRSEAILLHRCFDPSRFEYEDPAGAAEIEVEIIEGFDSTNKRRKVKVRKPFVRFPKPDCTCTERVKLSTRNQMLADGTALIVLRNGAAPSTDKFRWKELVAVPPGRLTLRATTASGRQRPHQLSQVERAIVFPDQRDRMDVYDQELEAPVFSIPYKPDGPDYEKELARTHVSQNPPTEQEARERRRGIAKRRNSGFSVGATLKLSKDDPRWKK